ncbi:MAG: AI-2E family transporter, partial [Actinomycetes bacterium]
MAVRPDLRSAGKAGRRTPVRPGPDAAPAPPEPTGPLPEEEGPAAGADETVVPEASATGAPSGATSVSQLGQPPIPRWLLLLVGLAAGTLAIAGLRAVAWLVAPVFLALVVVIALAPVQGWLRRIGVPRWLATTVLLILVWAVLLSFVALLVVSAAQLAALLPDYAGRAEQLTNDVVAELNTAGLVSGQLSDLIQQI